MMKSSMLQALNLASCFSANKVIVFITFAIYVQLGNTITASSVFVTVSLYSNTATIVTLYFPRGIELLFESYVSVQRIQVRGSNRIPSPGGGVMAIKVLTSLNRFFPNLNFFPIVLPSNISSSCSACGCSKGTIEL